MNGSMAKKIRRAAYQGNSSAARGTQYKGVKLVFKSELTNKIINEVEMIHLTSTGSRSLYRRLKDEYKRWKQRQIYVVTPRDAQASAEKSARRRIIAAEKAYRKQELEAQVEAWVAHYEGAASGGRHPEGVQYGTTG
jgi:hypothetical protein